MYCATPLSTCCFREKVVAFAAFGFYRAIFRCDPPSLLFENSSVLLKFPHFKRRKVAIFPYGRRQNASTCQSDFCCGMQNNHFSCCVAPTRAVFTGDIDFVGHSAERRVFSFLPLFLLRYDRGVSVQKVVSSKLRTFMRAFICLSAQKDIATLSIDFASPEVICSLKTNSILNNVVTLSDGQICSLKGGLTPKKKLPPVDFVSS